MRDINCDVANMPKAIGALVQSEELRNHGCRVRAEFSRRHVRRKGGVFWFVFQKWTKQVNEQKLEKHAVTLSALPFESDVQTHCITSTLGNWPSFGSISFGKFLCHVSSLMCRSLSFFSSACLLNGFSKCVGL